MPFNQMMGLPVALTLHPADEGLRLRANPIEEIESLRVSSKRLKPQSLAPGQNPLAGMDGELLDVEAGLSPGQAEEMGFVLRGVPVRYDVKRQELSCAGKKAVLPTIGGGIRLRLLVDRTSVDIFGNDGRLYMPIGIIVPQDDRTLSVYAKGGTAQIRSLKVHRLQSAWKRK
jgi:sucrose-6-phosphate hydrolase SacC (GH32 family)